MKTIGILLFDGVEELDAVGPWEVLAAGPSTYPEDGWAVTTLSRSRRRRHRRRRGCPWSRTTRGTTRRRWTCSSTPAAAAPGRSSPTSRSWTGCAAQRAGTVPLMTSVCTGSLVYAAAGLLHGRPATTYWSTASSPARDSTRRSSARPDDRFVDDGDVITAAGVSAGIDMALHLVARLSRPRARPRGPPRHPVRPAAPGLRLGSPRRGDAAGHEDVADELQVGIGMSRHTDYFRLASSSTDDPARLPACAPATSSTPRCCR